MLVEAIMQEQENKGKTYLQVCGDVLRGYLDSNREQRAEMEETQEFQQAYEVARRWFQNPISRKICMGDYNGKDLFYSVFHTLEVKE